MLALLAGCGSEPQPPMRVGAVLWPGNESLFFAAARGWLAPRDFRMVETSSGFEAIRGFRNGTLDAASLTYDEVIRAMQDGSQPVVLIALDESHGADAVLARPGIAALTALRGRRVGLQVNSVSAYLLRRALESAGMRSEDIEVVNVAPELHQAYLERGDVDAVATYEPFKSHLLEHGVIELFDSTAIPGEIGDVLVVRRDYAEAHPERAAALHQAWRRARAEAAGPAATAQAAKRLGVPPAVLVRMLTGLTVLDAPANRAAWQTQRQRLAASMSAIQGRLAAAGLISKQFPMAPLFDWPAALTARVWQD
ncbi:MAG: ABC transporter substrate-binding protein [Vicinamibacterales bacterium]